jgi:hypothetical protein
MREIAIGGKKVRVRATPLALLYYKQEFNADLVVDLSIVQSLAARGNGIDSVLNLQIIWAMAKADSFTESFGSKFPGFESWLSSFESINFTEPYFIAASMEEAADGFLGRGKVKAEEKE